MLSTILAPALGLTLGLALQVAPAPAQESDEIENEIVVMAERLRQISVNVGQDSEGRWHCSLSGSSGSDVIDSRLCRTTTGCVREHGGDRDAVEQCVRTHRSRTLEAFRQQLIEERS